MVGLIERWSFLGAFQSLKYDLSYFIRAERDICVDITSEIEVLGNVALYLSFSVQTFVGTLYMIQVFVSQYKSFEYLNTINPASGAF